MAKDNDSLWDYIEKHQIPEAGSFDLSSFKSEATNFKIALFNPQTNGVRYLRTLIFNLCQQLSDKHWEYLSWVKNRDLGDPIVVSFNNQKICLDYLQAALELDFLSEHLPKKNLNVLEIGAGYGRTAHALISNFQICSYTIVDREACRNLSCSYLSEVLSPEQFAKICFLSPDEYFQQKERRYEICLNIDSFNEMPAEVVSTYLASIEKNSASFYSKNPLGKFLDRSLDAHADGEQLVELALNSGLIRNRIDIFNQAEILKQRNIFLDTYCPSSSWTRAKDAWAPPWSYYWQALFIKR